MRITSLVFCVSALVSMAAVASNDSCAFTPNSLDLRVTLSSLPPTSAIGVLTGPGGEHIELLWDTTDHRRLQKVVRLPAGGTWTFSVRSEPIRYAVQPKENFGMRTTFSADACGAAVRTVPNADSRTWTFSFIDGSQPNNQGGPSAKSMLAQKSFSELAQTDSGGQSTLWSLGSLGDAATDLVATLGEIVVDKATAEATRLLQERLVSRLCEASIGLELKRTCALLKSIRVQDLAGVGNTLLSALQQDLVLAVFEKVKPKSGDITPVMSAITYAVIAAVSPLRQLTGAEPAQILDALKLLEPNSGQCPLAGKSNSRVCAILSTAVACLARDGQGCDPASLAELLANGSKVGIAIQPPFEPVAVQRAVALINRIRSIVRPAGDASVRQRIAGAIRATRELIDLAGVWPTDDEVKVRVAALLDLSEAVATSDVQSALAAVTSLVKSAKSAEWKTAARILGAMAGYLSTYLTEGKASAEEEMARREARKAALESLIESATDRNEREREWIFSLGGSLRVLGAGRHDFAQDSGKAWVADAPLSLPMGFALDMVPGPHGGFHMQVGVIDLGNYLKWEIEDAKTEVSLLEPEGPELFDFSLTLGWVIKGSSRNVPVYIGATAGYSPFVRAATNPADSRGSIYVGATLGFYVPFWDIN